MAKNISVWRFLTELSGVLCVLISGLVFLGWELDNTVLKSISPSWTPMKANTALGFLLAGSALALLRRPHHKSVWRDRFALIAGALVVLLGILTISEYILNRDIGIDRFLFRGAPVMPGDLRPGRMSPTAAFAFILVGSSLWLMVRVKPVEQLRQPLLAGLSIAIIIIAILALVGYILESVYRLPSWNYTGMALHTAIAFLLFGLGILSRLKDEGGFVWSLGPTISIGFAAAVLVLLISAATSHGLTTRLAETARAVSEVHEVLKEIEDIRSALSSLESSKRGYIILGDESLLVQRAEAKAEVRESFERLVALTIDDKRQKNNIELLLPLVARRIAFSEKTIVLRRQRGFEAARNEIETQTGIQLSREIQKILERMRGEEYELLGRRKLMSDATTMTAILLLPLGVFVGLALLSCGVFLLNAGVAERKQAESRAAYQADLLSNVSDAIIATDKDLRVTSWNLAAERLYGYKEVETLGRYSRNFVHSDMSEGERAEILRQLAEQGSARFEIVHFDRHGRRLDIEAHTIMLRDAKGQISGIVSVNRDITERKRTEEELAASEIRFRALIENSYEGLSLTSSDRKTIYRSPGGHKITGHGVGDEPLIHDVHPDDLLVMKQKINEALLAPGDPVPFEVRLRHAGGHFIWIEGTLNNLLNIAGVNAVVTNYRDITARKFAEEKIRLLNSELEQRVLERTRELTAANKELEAFSYSVSHDLRAPLRGIDGWSQALWEDFGNTLSEEGRSYIARVRSEAQRMGELIDAMLKLSRVTRADMQRRRVDLSALALRIADRLSASEPGRRVTFDIQPGLICDADNALLEIALDNLMGNAFKFTGKKDTALIEVGATIQDNQRSYFVRDNGAGFDVAHARQLFGAFQRMHRLSEFPGTGIGLATVQRIIHRHGGSVRAEAAVAQGAAFYFTLGEAG